MTNHLYQATFLMLVARLSVKAISVVSSIILARLLVPEDFGLVAICMSIYGLIELLSYFGFGSYLIQKTDATAEDYNNTWSLKLLFALSSAVLLVLTSGLAANFFNEQRVQPLLWMLALISAVTGLSNIGTVNFQKHLDFKAEMLFQIIPKVVTFFFTIGAALALRSYWALVIGMLVNEIFNVLLSYRMSSFRPKFELKKSRQIFSFSKWILLDNCASYLNKKLPSVISGYQLGPASTGLFSLADEIGSLPTAEVTAPINRATFPIYAANKDDRAQLTHIYLSTLNLNATLSLPAAVGIALISPLFVPVVLGVQWLSVVPILQLLALAGFFASLSTNVGYIFLAKGAPRFLLWINAGRAFFTVSLLLFLVPLWGLTGLASALLLSAVAMLFITQVLARRVIDITVFSFIKSIYRPVCGVVVMSSMLWLPGFHTPTPTLGGLILFIMFGMVSYILTTAFLWQITGKPDGIERKITNRILSFIQR
jgi:O-antigen/teichoic acid export membrane protein